MRLNKTLKICLVVALAVTVAGFVMAENTTLKATEGTEVSYDSPAPTPESSTEVIVIPEYSEAEEPALTEAPAAEFVLRFSVTGEGCVYYNDSELTGDFEVPALEGSEVCFNVSAEAAVTVGGYPVFPGAEGYKVKADGDKNIVVDFSESSVRWISSGEDGEAAIMVGAVVREHPDGMSAIIAEVTEESEISIVETTTNWLLVSIDGLTGYIYIEDTAVEPPTSEAVEPGAEKLLPAVEIFSSRRSVMTVGEPVVLTSILHNTDGYELLLQWQVDTGSGFEDIAGANGDSFTFEANAETLSYNWRLMLYYRPLSV